MAIYLSLKHRARGHLDSIADTLGYSRTKPAFLSDIFGRQMFQNPGDAGINYASLSGQSLEQYRFGEIALAKTLKPTDVVLDVGANIGFFTLLYARQAAHVHAFEPGIQSHALLQANVAINNLSNVTTYHKAVSDYDGSAKFLLCRTGDSDNRLNDNSGEDRQEVAIDVVKLDTVFGASKVDFLKMDIQGAELAALKGLRQTIATNPYMRILIEYAPLCLIQAGADPLELPALAKNSGFVVSILHEDRAPEITDDTWLAANCGPGRRHPHLNLLLERPSRIGNPHTAAATSATARAGLPT